MSIQLIETVVVTDPLVYSVDFTDIPQDGNDLLLVISHRSPDAGTGAALFGTVNGVTSNYRWVEMSGTGTATNSNSFAFQSVVKYGIIQSGSYTANTFGNTSVYFPNYTSSALKNFFSESVTENRASAAEQHMIGATLPFTSPITAISITKALSQYSTASLYKITAD